MTLVLNDHQRAVVERPVESKVFLEGPAGSGKTTVGVARLLRLLKAQVAARSILVIVPQRTLAAPYYEALRRPTIDAGGQVAISTVGGLAQRMVDLFWPLVAGPAGFAHPEQPPTFLTLETAQYTMARLVRPLLDQHYFETVVIDRNRLYSQIIDNLNKAAVVGFPNTEIGQRLREAWNGEPSQRRIYDEAQAAAGHFRSYCLANNLLDFSLQMEVFRVHLWSLPLCRDYLLSTYAHLIVDGVEEDTPTAHDILREWLGEARSALVIADGAGGYRRFLGADPDGGLALAGACQERVVLSESLVMSGEMRVFGEELARSLGHGRGATATPAASDLYPANARELAIGVGSAQPLARSGPARKADQSAQSAAIRAVLAYETHRYYPQMLDWVAQQAAELVHGQGVPPAEIAVLAPYLSDTLRFSLADRLAHLGVPVRSHRPSRALREEPATHCLLTLAKIAHPGWAMCPSQSDVAYALRQAIEGLDLVRAQLLAAIVYRPHDGHPALSSFERLVPEMQDRLTYVFGARYDKLRQWLEEYAAAQGGVGSDSEAFDHFLSRLFGELLSQPGYGFHRDYDAGRLAATLIESVQKFRWAAQAVLRGSEEGERKPLGQEYVEMVEDGVIAAQYVLGWQAQPEDAVLLAPAHTFLMRDRPVDCQFWLNVGSAGWWERLYQPLTHPYVLSRHWPCHRVWSDADEVQAREEALRRLVLGLVQRCRRRIYLGLSELDEHGNEHKGPLLQTIQRVLRRQR